MGRGNLGDIGIDRRIKLLSQNTRYEDTKRLQLAEIVPIRWYFGYCNKTSRSV
jgi:hypothetical protein